MTVVGRLVALASLVLLAPASMAGAQERVRVIRDQTVIWRAGFIVVEAVVALGTEWDVVARRGDWYQIALPESATRPRSTGFVAAARVSPVGRDGAAGTGLTGPRPTVTRQPDTLARTGVRGFGHLGVGRFSARRAFSSVLGSSAGAWFGGGVEERRGPWTFEGAVEMFRRTGERAYVLNGRVFTLGIPDTVTLVPVSVTAGYRRRVSRGWSVVGGGGLGRYFFRETARVSGEAETFTTQATSYHVRADLEWHRRGLIATAAEIQYTWVPGALSSGLAGSFDERDLGGVQLRLKVLVGR